MDDLPVQRCWSSISESLKDVLYLEYDSDNFRPYLSYLRDRIFHYPNNYRLEEKIPIIRFNPQFGFKKLDENLYYSPSILINLGTSNNISFTKYMEDIFKVKSPRTLSGNEIKAENLILSLLIRESDPINDQNYPNNQELYNFISDNNSSSFKRLLVDVKECIDESNSELKKSITYLSDIISKTCKSIISNNESEKYSLGDRYVCLPGLFNTGYRINISPIFHTDMELPKTHFDMGLINEARGVILINSLHTA